MEMSRPAPTPSGNGERHPAGAGKGYADKLFDLTGKVVLITGGSRGLGREMAFAAARCGADVVVASRKLAACEATATAIEAETGRAAMAYAVHVGRWDQLDGLVDAVYARFGRVDVLINNAGMSPVYDNQTDVTEKMFDAVVNLNLKGPFRLSALVGERMIAAGGGVIINVSTHGSIRPDPSFIPYAAAKAGLNAMTEGLAQAFGPSVRVNTLMPGPFLTDISKAWNFGGTSNPFGHSALRRAGEPGEIVGAAMFLMSDASSYTTGSILRADGGVP
jgi:NAD(P)-dependent dehydrogenase (short-subunit alcohol dehydrogenase family)